MSSKFMAFTTKSGGILRDLKTPCGVSIVFDPKDSASTKHPITQFNGLWDTGATGSAISKNIVEKLGLKPTGVAKVFHADGESMVNTYLINIYLPNKVAIPAVRVTEGTLTGFDLLIGMDIITMGDFSITNVSGKTTFSFRMPSIREIDYVSEGNSLVNNSKPKNPFIGASLNKPCPCGNGKLFKHCHGKK